MMAKQKTMGEEIVEHAVERAKGRKPRRVRWYVQWNFKTQLWDVRRKKVLYACRSTQAEAIKRAVEVIKATGERAELLIRVKATGQFRTPRTYGDDPVATKG